jgi:hypothetical protein
VPSRGTLGRIVAAAFAFGMLAALAKGQSSDGIATMSQLRSVLGNLSTPWLLVPFIAGIRCVRRSPAAIVGLLATLAALAGFYVLTTLVVDLGHHGLLGDLRLELSANRGYFEGGLVAGPLFGGLGCWWRQTRTLPISIAAGVLLMAEPLVLLLGDAVGPHHVLAAESRLPLIARMVWGWGLGGGSGAIALFVYGIEFALGLVVVLVVMRRRPARVA